MRTVRLLGIACSAVLVFATSASAFKPNEAGHLGITTQALAPIERTVGSQTFRFSERALDEIRDANRNTDIITFFGVAEHFDDEAFVESSRRLINLKEAVIAQSLAGQGEGAREDLGGALHTVQDFYSHSNWVELGLAGIETRLGRAEMQPLSLDQRTCEDDFATLVDFGLTSETTGYFPFFDLCGGPPDGTPAGKCRHGVEFICPDGLNKDAPGRPGFETAHARAVDATIDYANQILDALAGNAAALATLMGTEAAEGRILIIEAGLHASQQKSYAIPVDSTVERLKVKASVLGLQLLRPSGTPVQPGESGVTFNDENGTRKIIVDSPEDGIWTAQLPIGNAKFTLSAGAKSHLQIDRFDFVTFTGGIGHEGFTPITDPPRIGATLLGLAQVIGPVSNVRFSLVDQKGKTLQSVSLAPGNPEAGADELTGTIKIPKKPFRFAMTGQDPSGAAVQRVFPTRYVPR
jgi:hypothetical protein